MRPEAYDRPPRKTGQTEGCGFMRQGRKYLPHEMVLHVIEGLGEVWWRRPSPGMEGVMPGFEVA